MIRIYVAKPNYSVSTAQLKKRLENFLSGKKLVLDYNVDVSFVSEKVMLDIAKKYLSEDNVLHNVLSFPSSEVKGKFIEPKEEKSLGEIIICYPKTIEEAKKYGKTIDNYIYELVEHGARHLLGEHHD